jgi:hypothetical protein
LWRLRLSQARAELHIARGEWSEAVIAATQCITDSQARSRPKYVVLGLLARAEANFRRDAQIEALSDVARAASLADALGDPAIQLRALRLRLQIDGDDALTATANAIRTGIATAIEDADLRSRFLTSLGQA